MQLLFQVFWLVGSTSPFKCILKTQELARNTSWKPLQVRLPCPRSNLESFDLGIWLPWGCLCSKCSPDLPICLDIFFQGLKNCQPGPPGGAVASPCGGRGVAQQWAGATAFVAASKQGAVRARRSIKSGLPHKNLEENHIVHHHHNHHENNLDMPYVRLFSASGPRAACRLRKNFSIKGNNKKRPWTIFCCRCGGERVLMLLYKLLHAERISKLTISRFSGQVTVTLHLFEFGSLNTSHSHKD